jgi:hypothetical protein
MKKIIARTSVQPRTYDTYMRTYIIGFYKHYGNEINGFAMILK